MQSGKGKPATVVDSRKRLRLLLGAFSLVILAVFLRTMQIQLAEGAAFRDEATRPMQRTTHEPGVRGRILSADGAVLAETRNVPALAVPYRLLQEPADRGWLRREARSQLPRAERRSAARLAAAEADVLAERAAMHERLAQACGVSPDVWHKRCAAIQRRVERIAQNVNRRAEATSHETAAIEPATLGGKIARALRETLGAARDEPPERIIVREEVDGHVLAEDLSDEAAEAIEREAKIHLGVKIVQLQRRFYPQGSLLAHAIGHLGPRGEQDTDSVAGTQSPAADLVGRMGLERRYQRVLCGVGGLRVEMTGRGGRPIAGYFQQEPVAGCTLRLTLDSRLQRMAEELLAAALSRRAAMGHSEPAGGAIVAIDVRTGAVLAAASAPRFDPNWFSAHDNAQLTKALKDTSQPMFDRAARMAIAPGSVFKTLTAVALLESDAVHAEDAFTCQGYWKSPDRHRCEIFVRRGVGHGKVNLYDALAESCNVYFFEHAAAMGIDPLLLWADRFGFGRATGIDLASEAAGTLPSPQTIESLEGHAWRTADTQSLAIGQGSLTATPLQIVRMMAAVANGGSLPAPYLVERIEPPANGKEEADMAVSIPPPQPVEGLHRSTVKATAEGLRRVVEADQGSAHATVFMESIPVAGKTGTAETGGGRAAHAWFAGYVPADRPKIAFVVALEHSGGGAAAAGPVAKRLVMAMRELGMIE